MMDLRRDAAGLYSGQLAAERSQVRRAGGSAREALGLLPCPYRAECYREAGMNQPPKRRLLDAFSGSPTYLGEQTRFIGNVESAGPVVLCGEVAGDGRIQGALNLAVSGHWAGTVYARQAVIAGKVTGNLIIEDKLEIGQTAVIRGSVTARQLAIAKGAVVDGDITITSGAPIQRFEEKRT
jgi:cytoskeletal protein CcmA (bactofilin family)